jgi:xanthine dehydrogenase accessory factor
MIEPLILIRGGGDLASGVAVRLHRSAFPVAVAELEKPLAVRRMVSFAEAIYSGEIEIEGVRGKRADDGVEAQQCLNAGIIPVIVDPRVEIAADLKPAAVIDARMRKSVPDPTGHEFPLLIGLGPGFTVGIDCHAVVETNRGHHMGRVYWRGSAEVDTSIPDAVSGFDVNRVLRAPTSGVFHAKSKIGAIVEQGVLLGEVDGELIRAGFRGAVRGLLHDDIVVTEGEKVGDIDPRGVPEYCFEISDKSLAVGGGVLEALLHSPPIRKALGA